MNQPKAVVIGGIRACDTRIALESAFDLFEVDDRQKRIDILIEAMYTPEVFFSCNNPELEVRYDLTIEMFLSMDWKITELYHNTGLHDACLNLK